jgi:hypothetical protein
MIKEYFMSINLKKEVSGYDDRKTDQGGKVLKCVVSLLYFSLLFLTFPLGWITTLVIYIVCMVSPFSFLFSFDQPGSFWKIFILGPLAVISWFVFACMWRHILLIICNFFDKYIGK